MRHDLPPPGALRRDRPTGVSGTGGRLSTNAGCLGYGHASVAEHAVIHMAVENISRLACDALEDNRLASYTEKSSRYQVIDQGHYHVPKELDDHPELLELYKTTCDGLFQAYQGMTEAVAEGLQGQSGMTPPRAQRTAIDSCRFLLPTATLTNVGVTMNAQGHGTRGV